jgi:hypothetical protein
MSRVSKILHEVHAGDLIFVAISKQNPVEWTDLVLICNQEVLRTVHLGNGSSKTIRQSIVEYLEHEQRPIGIFRQHDASLEKRESLVGQMLGLLSKPLSLWVRLCSLFKKPVLEFNWENERSIKLMLLDQFRKSSIKQLEESGTLVRLM